MALMPCTTTYGNIFLQQESGSGLKDPISQIWVEFTVQSVFRAILIIRVQGKDSACGWITMASSGYMVAGDSIRMAGPPYMDC